MTIAIKHKTSGEIQFVEGVAGYSDDWAQFGPELPPESDPARISLEGGEWVENLAICRNERWEAVKSARDRTQVGGCNTPLGRVDTTVDSQIKIAGAVQMAMIAQATAQPFAIEWTMQDNSTVAHDADAMIQMGVAVGRHIAACHETALLKRAEIGEAADASALAAVNVDTDWPA